MSNVFAYISIYIWQILFQGFHILAQNPPPHAPLNYLVEWAIALHGMYKSALIFISISKQKNLYIVGYVQCDNRIFPAARIKILP